jgi:hypothetical protein
MSVAQASLGALLTKLKLIDPKERGKSTIPFRLPPPVGASTAGDLPTSVCCCCRYISPSDVRAGRPYPYMIFHLMESLEVLDVRTVAKVGH